MGKNTCIDQEDGCEKERGKKGGGGVGVGLTNIKGVCFEAWYNIW